MILSVKNNGYLIEVLLFVVIMVLMFLIGEIMLPFILALFISYLLNPIILKIQKRIKNKNLALTSFFFGSCLLLIGTVFFFGGHVVKDSKRLVNTVDVFGQQNEEQIKKIKNKVLVYAGQVYESDFVKEKIEGLDSVTVEGSQKNLMSTLSSVYSFFETPEKNGEDEKSESWSLLYIVFYTLIYTVFILYSYDYFEGKYDRYLANRKTSNSMYKDVLADFKIIFVNYFKQRTKVVFLNIAISIISFSIVDLPGAIIIGIVTGILSYASHFHYLSLPLTAIGCWVLSVEHDTNFFIYFGMVLFVYIVISILEETLYFDKIMKSVSGMNPAIIVLSFALWISIFGEFNGTIIALPLTQLILIYVDRFLLYWNENRLDELGK